MSNGAEKRCNLLWIDLEMTGLNAEYDTILEIAVIASDMALENVIEGPSIIIHQSDESLQGMNDFVKKMHQSSGLTDAVKDSKIGVAQAEAAVIEFVKNNCAEKFFFAGNSVYQDRTFLRRYMPALHELAHYRLIDVSTIKELLRAWHPEDKQLFKKKDPQHRALFDIHGSIEELRYYKKNYFVQAKL